MIFIIDDIYVIPDSLPSHLTEKNEATSATAQEISRKVPKKKKKGVCPKRTPF